MFGTPLPIPCTNCHDKQLRCEAHPHTKGSCYHCIVTGLPCLFPPNTILRHGSPDAFRFQRNCVHCTRSHQKCVFDDTDSPLQCKRCMKLEIPCLFQLSSQGSRNDLNASTDPKDVMRTILMKSAVVCEGRSTELDGAHSPPKPLDPNGRSVNANESVHYHHCSNGYSCHGRVEQVTVSDVGASTDPKDVTTILMNGESIEEMTKSPTNLAMTFTIVTMKRNHPLTLRVWYNRCTNLPYSNTTCNHWRAATHCRYQSAKNY